MKATKMVDVRDPSVTKAAVIRWLLIFRVFFFF